MSSYIDVRPWRRGPLYALLVRRANERWIDYGGVGLLAACAAALLWGMSHGSRAMVFAALAAFGAYLYIVFVSRSVRAAWAIARHSLETAREALAEDTEASFAAAIEACNRVLSLSLGAGFRAAALEILAHCAMRRGDFADAEALARAGGAELARADIELSRRDAAIANLVFVRAFALAALGREADAARALEDAPPGDDDLKNAVRALILARRGEVQALRELLATWSFVESEKLGPRVKALLARLARMCGGGTAYRTAGEAAEIDHRLASWVESALGG